ncbi:trimeric intracellular cation channel family protein [Chitinophagaceae bacterium LWZ2-11]
MDLSFFSILNILGTFAFAVSGVSVAIDKGYDLFGVIVLGFVTAIGGGTLRDIMIGATPVAWMSDRETIITIITAIIISAFFFSHVQKLRWSIIIFDSLGLGIFTLIGVQKGLDYHLSGLVCTILGTITGTFGGVIRDVFSGDKPMLFQKEVYASASIAGGTLYFLLGNIESYPTDWIATTCILFIVILRLIAVRYNLSLPKLSNR